MESVLEDVVKQNAARPSDIDLATRRAEEAAARRYEAAAWLRTVGVVGAKDLPEEPSEEEFRIGLRNGIILCNFMNKVQPGAIPKVVEAPIDSLVIPDGAPLLSYQYFENVRNFLVTLQDIGLSTFEASDLEKGGKSCRVVDSVLSLKSYIEGKQVSKNGSSKFGGIAGTGCFSKHFIRKSSDPFMNFIPRTQSSPEKSSDGRCLEDNLNGDCLVQSTELKSSHSLNKLIRTALSNKNPKEVPLVSLTFCYPLFVTNLSVTEHEQERLMRMEQQLKLEANSFQDRHFLQQHIGKSMEEVDPAEMEEKTEVERPSKELAKEMKQKAIKEKLIRQQLIFDRQQKQIQELKCTIHYTKTSMEYLKKHHSEEFGNLGNQLRALASVASGYHKVLKENRKLYNQVQDLKGNIRVYCRVRPFLPGQTSSMSTRIVERVATVEFGAAKINKDNSEAKDLKKQIAALKLELARRSAGEPFRPAKFSPNLVRLKTDYASSVHFNDEEDELVYLTSNRQSLDEAGNTENRFDSDLEDFENSASVSSEVELLSHLSVSKIPIMADVGLSKLKRAQAKGIKSMDGRNLSHGNIPFPSRKVLNEVTQIPNRTAARQPVSNDGKRSGIKSSAK